MKRNGNDVPNRDFSHFHEIYPISNMANLFKPEWHHHAGIQQSYSAEINLYEKKSKHISSFHATSQPQNKASSTLYYGNQWHTEFQIIIICGSSASWRNGAKEMQTGHHDRLLRSSHTATSLMWGEIPSNQHRTLHACTKLCATSHLPDLSSRRAVSYCSLPSRVCARAWQSTSRYAPQ